MNVTVDNLWALAGGSTFRHIALHKLEPPLQYVAIDPGDLLAVENMSNCQVMVWKRDQVVWVATSVVFSTSAQGQFSNVLGTQRGQSYCFSANSACRCMILIECIPKEL
jgi:hypothetical protein